MPYSFWIFAVKKKVSLSRQNTIITYGCANDRLADCPILVVCLTRSDQSVSINFNYNQSITFLFTNVENCSNVQFEIEFKIERISSGSEV